MLRLKPPHPNGVKCVEQVPTSSANTNAPSGANLVQTDEDVIAESITSICDALNVGGSGQLILEGWFIGLGEGEAPPVGGVGVNTPDTLLNRFSQPLIGNAPFNNYPDTSFFPSKAGTITELQIRACGVQTSSGQLIASILKNGVVVGATATLNNVNRIRIAVVQAIAYVPGDFIDIQYRTINYNPPGNGLVAQLRIQE